MLLKQAIVSPFACPNTVSYGQARRKNPILPSAGASSKSNNMFKSTFPQPPEQRQDAPGHYALVNGLTMYYELRGSGQPLVLLPGGFATIDLSFGQLLPTLSKTRQVIAVELQGHGHTADIDRPLYYELMADDIAALLTHLGLGQVDLFRLFVGRGRGATNCDPASRGGCASSWSPRPPARALAGPPRSAQAWP